MLIQMREYVIRKDSLPIKILRIEKHRVSTFMRRLQIRFPGYKWSVCDRFLLNGSD